MILGRAPQGSRDHYTVGSTVRTESGWAERMSYSEPTVGTTVFCVLDFVFDEPAGGIRAI
jgi:hypothetical protein